MSLGIHLSFSMGMGIKVPSLSVATKWNLYITQQQADPWNSITEFYAAPKSEILQCTVAKIAGSVYPCNVSKVKTEEPRNSR